MGLSYRPAKDIPVDRAIEQTRGLFKDMQIDDVRTWYDKSKVELIELFEILYNQTIDFDERAKPSDTLAIIIRWIGWDIKIYNNYDNMRYEKEAEDEILTNFIFGSDEYKKDLFGLTKFGEAFCVEDYCVHLANQKSTHVILFQDLHEGPRNAQNHVEWQTAQCELNLKDNSGLARFCMYQT